MLGTKREPGKKPATAPRSPPAKAKSAPAKKPSATARKPEIAPATPVKGKPAKTTAKTAPASPKKANAAAKAPPRPAPAPKAKPAARKAEPLTTPSRPGAKPAVRNPSATPKAKPGAAQTAKSKAAATRSAIDVAFALSKLHQVALLATDLDRSIAFYRDVLGLAYMDRYDPPGLAFFHLGGGTRLILSATSSKATLYFKVDDIDSAVSALAARGVFFLHRPSMIHRDDKGRLGKKGVEEWMAFFKDPSDNVLALVAQRVG